MKIENTLNLSIPPEKAWLLLLDIPFVAPCLPGTELTKIIDERTYEGKVQLKLGPISLAFKGEAVIEEINLQTMTVRISAKGREDRGRGSAHADVVFQLHEENGTTRVDVTTDLALVGSIIQYARGASVVTRTAQSLVDQFAARLSKRIETGEIPDPEAIKVGSLLWQGLKARIKGNKQEQVVET